MRLSFCFHFLDYGLSPKEHYFLVLKTLRIVFPFNYNFQNFYLSFSVSAEHFNKLLFLQSHLHRSFTTLNSFIILVIVFFPVHSVSFPLVNLSCFWIHLVAFFTLTKSIGLLLVFSIGSVCPTNASKSSSSLT